MELWRHIGVIEAGKGLIFNPHASMAPQISAAADAINAVFGEIDSSLDKGHSISNAMKGRRVTAAMHRVIASSRFHGFLHGAEISKKHMPSNYGTVIRADAENRAKEVNRLMRRTSKSVLHNKPDSEYALSKDRALSTARFEAGNSYFAGVKDAFQGTDWGKKWITGDGDSCIECQDNEDQGTIDVDDTFQSGHDYPLGHQNCGCWVEMRKSHA